VRPHLKKITKAKKGGGAEGVAQMVECLPSNHKALSSNPPYTAKNKEKESNKGNVYDGLKGVEWFLLLLFLIILLIFFLTSSEVKYLFVRTLAVQVPLLRTVYSHHRHFLLLVFLSSVSRRSLYFLY
jgi:hypothetical protein